MIDVTYYFLFVNTMEKKNYTTTPQEIKQYLNNSNYTEALQKLHENIDIDVLFYRFDWIRTFKSWALPPTLEQLEEIYQLFHDLTILEVGCGSGLWSAILKSRGLNVISTDSKIESGGHHYYDYNNQKEFIEYTIIEQLDAKYGLEKYGSQSNVLFVSWGRGFITKHDFDNFKGKYVISIGEGHGGCTCNGYVDELDNNSEWKVLKKIKIPKWFGMHDKLVIYEKL